jgi:hypothetical protein
MLGTWRGTAIFDCTMSCTINNDAANVAGVDMERHRRSVRLQNYDYAQNGAYFLTICTHNRDELLGQVSNQSVQLSHWGKIAEVCWQQIPEHFPQVELDEYVFMPNHFHAVFVITDIIRARRVVPLQARRSENP